MEIEVTLEEFTHARRLHILTLSKYTLRERRRRIYSESMSSICVILTSS
jgi:hypothetical protein